MSQPHATRRFGLRSVIAAALTLGLAGCGTFQSHPPAPAKADNVDQIYRVGALDQLSILSLIHI